MKAKQRLLVILIVILVLISTFLYILVRNNGISLNNSGKNKGAATDVLTLSEVEEPLPVYKDFVQIKSEKEVQNLGNVYRVDYESHISVSELSKWFLEELPKNNWKIDTLPADPLDENVQLIYAVTPNQLVHISLVKDTETSKTKINYQVISRKILDVEEGEEEEGE